MRRRPVFLLLAVVVAVVGGCGDSKKEPAGDGGTTTSSVAPGDTTGGGTASPGGPGGTAPGSPSAGPSGSPTTGPGTTGGTTGGTEDTRPPLAVSVELANSCVRPGGTQTVIVRSAPGAAAGYDTTWSDGKNGLSGGYGGTGNGHLDGAGTWRSDFVVGPGAPAGKATLTALAAHMSGGSGRASADFTVASLAGTCA